MNFEEAKKVCIKFFNGNELAADVFLKKYALTTRDSSEILEPTPVEMWKRLANAAADVEKDKKHWAKEFLEILRDFKAVPQGSIMFALGNTYQKSSCSNCFVFDVEDTIEGIFDTAKDMARTYSYRGGCGLDISSLRPASAIVTNAAKSSSGAASFMDFYSNVTRMICLHGRRGALMLTINIDHPDVELFAIAKHDLTKVTGANISIKITDAFMRAVQDNKDWVASFKTKHEVIRKEWKARDLWKVIVDSATKTAEPGILFWDNIIKNSPADCYADDGFKTVSTNPCQPAFAPVLTAHGLAQFKDIEVGDEIWSETGWTNVVNKQSTGVKEVFKYRTSAGVFYGTENHRIVQNGEKIEVKDAESIDTINGREIITMAPNPKSKTQEIMDGLIVGDGSCHKASNDKIYLNIGANDQDYFNSEIKELIVGQNGISRDLSFDVATTITPSELPHTYNRFVPERYKFSDQITICAFLRGLYSANGSVVSDRVTLKATSKQIIEDVQLMLSATGIRSYFTRNKPSKIKWANGEYTSKESFDLNITTDRDRFYNLIGFIQVYKNEKLKSVLNIKKSNTKKKTYDIIEKESLGEMEVFDITVDNDPHTYWTGACNVSNCSELPLAAMDACTLLSMNLSKYTKSDFTKDAFFDEPKFFHDVVIATRFLDNVKTIDAELVPLQKQKEMALKGRRIGMGIHGLADAMANLGIKYDSEAGVKFIDSLFEKYTKAVYSASVSLAKEKGVFPIFDKKKEKNHPFLERIGFAGIPRRNIACMTLAPTGTVSILSETSSGIEPVFRNSYKRRVKIAHNMSIKPEDKDRIFVDNLGDKWLEYEVFHENVKRYIKETGNKDLPEHFTTSDQIDWKKRVEIQAAITKWLDHSCSSTVNLPKGTTSDVVGKIYFEAWKSGCKGMTVYVDGCRDGVLITEDDKKEEKKIYTAIERPDKIPCDIYQIQADGSKWVVIIGLVDGKPYEVFCGKQNKVELGKIESGYIEKEGKSRYSLHIGEDTILRDISDIFTDTQGALTRMISTSLRHNVDIQFIVQQLEKSDGTIASFNKAISRVLKKYIIDGTKESGVKCSHCDAETLIRQEGCISCTSCGWSKCG